jgi:glutathione peroxidase
MIVLAKEVSMSSVYDIPLKRITGEPTSLRDYQGSVLLVVNVASKCGLTKQYEGLEKLYEARHAQGLEVLGFPANNFKGQEPGSDAEIQEFCKLTYDVKFPMFSKISVKGADRHPLYDALTSAQPAATGEGPFRERLKGGGIESGKPDEVLWNFEKFLVNRQGEVVARFSPDVTASDPRLLAAVDAELAKH